MQEFFPVCLKLLGSRREILIFHGLEIYSVSGRECCPEHFFGIGCSIHKGLLVLGLSVHTEHMRCAQWLRRSHQIRSKLLHPCHTELYIQCFVL